MTLPAQSLPDATQPHQAPPEPPHERELPFPLTFIAVVGLTTLVIILCVLGGVVSGAFGLLGGGAEPAAGPSQTPSFVPPPARPPAETFDDGQWIVDSDIVAGVYETTVPADSAGCAWEHAASTDGTVNSLIGTGTANGGEKIVLVLSKADEVVRSEGCGVWHRTTL